MRFFLMTDASPHDSTIATPRVRFSAAERRLKLLDLVLLLAAGLIAAKISDNRGLFNPTFFIGFGIYQVVMSALFLVLAWKRKRTGAVITPESVSDDSLRLRRWRRFATRLPFQLDYVLRAVVGVGLVAWGLILMRA